MTEAAGAILNRVMPYLGIALLAFIAWTQHGTIAAQDTAITTLKDHAATVAAQLRKMNEAQDKADSNSRLLQMAQDNFRATLTQREIDIRRLQNDVQGIRDWADQPLPGAVIRMRQRPAITGSASYAEFLSDHQPLHAVGERPAAKRGPESSTGANGK